MNLSAETLEKIDATIAQFPQKRSATLPILHLIQEELGHLSLETQEWVAEKLGVQPIQIREVVTFYPMYREEPIGKVHVKVCRTLSCALSGAYKTCEKLEEKLNCKRGKTSADGNYTIEFVECIACCGSAPVVQVDDKLYENVKPEGAEELAEEIKKMAAAEATNAAETPQPQTPAYFG
ncbi:NAD(P)H-dependent oxidoreductase subunit E [Rubellicoccus peritrichatus]|uniref:NAD(P)H-dependent oxidoreductase subunit E n=1 Tax=Rubellicoccus peritrichatus TaxID=3080537 RepID=A0AAQ3L4Z6_9BACT|nr:NAD(P)H-dependent oxidoreductase subunit E [Puniceicoccus sp. CR14]WOO39479.1 NAD(P)H-dependent oxidoreductase subunit E [Puniceicoccus sp. CR14]